MVTVVSVLNRVCRAALTGLLAAVIAISLTSCSDEHQSGEPVVTVTQVAMIPSPTSESTVTITPTPTPTGTPAPAAAATATPTRQQEPDRPPVLLRDCGGSIEDSEEGRWHLCEIDRDGLQAAMFLMLTPGDRLTTSYQCSVVAGGGIGSGPTVGIKYPEDLPKNLTPEDQLERGIVPAETVVKEEVLPVEWMRMFSSDTGIFLSGEDAQLLVRRIGETDAESYRLVFPGHPELDRTVPSPGLGEIAGEVMAECESWDYGSSAAGSLRPPQVVQEPVDGQYTYTDPDGRFTLRYPADCGQMWEAPGLADNTDRCPDGEPAISTSVEWHDVSFAGLNDRSPDQFARDYADNLAAGAAAAGDLTSRDTLKTEAGHVLEMVDLEWESEEGGGAAQIAVFVDGDLWMITVFMSYPADETHLHGERVRGAFKTFSPWKPVK